MNRFDQTLALLIMLQSRRLVKAKEIAYRFGVSICTVYRDIVSLETAGIPIIGEAGAGYSIMEGYRLPPIMFSKEEAGSFVAAEKLMQKFMDAGLGRYFESAMHKLRSVLKSAEKDWLAQLERQVWAKPSFEMFNKDVPNAMEVLFNSIAEQTQVYLKYLSTSAELPEDRMVEPVGVFHESSHWYLLAY